MKKFFSFISFLITCMCVNAQSFNNEWIDYTKTYWKFKVGKTGLYRITPLQLQAAGLDMIPAEQFQLWRNGKEVALFTTVPSGVIGANDYIEFWGQQNDGKPDKALYKNPTFQQSDAFSLETDTAAYFLTVNSGTNLRFQTTANNVTAGLTPMPYLMYTIRQDFKQQLNKGKAIRISGIYIYSSTYDAGEGWTTNDISSTGLNGFFASDIQLATAGSAATLSVGVSGNSIDGFDRKAVISVNGSKIIQQALPTFDSKIFSASVPVSLLQAKPNTDYTIGFTSSFVLDRMVSSFIELTYPRQFRFDNATQFRFQLPAQSQPAYIEISDFNGGTDAVLYDLTNNRRYVAVFSSGVYKVLLQPFSNNGEFVIVSQNASNILPVKELTKKNFINYANQSNHGSYLFVTGKKFVSGSILSQYKTYRSSSAGGGYISAIVDEEELTDQFAFGIKKHPLGIKNFLRYARQKFASPPKYCFLVGKGITYDDYRKNESNPLADELNIVPTFGYPASDVLLASDNYAPIATTLIGRISVVNEKELSDYFEKVKEHELQQKSTTQTVAEKKWMKNVAFVAGSNSGFLEATIDSYFSGYKAIIEDSLPGDKTTYFSNSTTGPITPAVNKKLNDLFTEGISLFNYFGHSSAVNLDYTIDDPSTFKNQGKYPLFLLNGCDAGNVFSFDPSRLNGISSLVEKFVLSPKSGAIGFIGSTHYGITTYLDLLNTGFYRSLRKTGYGKSVSFNLTEAEKFLVNYPADSVTRYLQSEEHVLNADPAISIHASPKPDYAVEQSDIVTSPSIINVTDNSFDVKVYLHNIGRYEGDSINVSVKRILPDGSDEILIDKKIKPISYLDSLDMKVPFTANNSKGLNKIVVSIDDLNNCDEMSEMNNTAEKSFQIIANDLIPLYPSDLSVVPAAPKTFYASTADIFLEQQTFFFEADTTQLFNSPIKYSSSILTKGGLIGFNYPLPLKENTVYYWRVGTEENGIKKWRSSSFIFMSNKTGFSQAHLYQHQQSQTTRLNISEKKNWSFTQKENTLRARIATWGTAAVLQSEVSVLINGEIQTRSFCLTQSVAVNIFDANTLKPLINQSIPSIQKNMGEGGFMGSALTCDPNREINFEFYVNDAASRQKLKTFLDWIPDGYYVVLRNKNDPYSNEYVQQWKQDASLFGAGNTLYDKLKASGFVGLENYTVSKSWAFIYKKNDQSFQPIEKFTAGITDKVSVDATVYSSDSTGIVVSPKIGPATEWKTVEWNGVSNSIYNESNAELDVYAVNISNGKSLIGTVKPGKSLDVSTVSAQTYPYLQLQMRTRDGQAFIPYQLKQWTVLYTSVPEGALDPLTQFDYKDTVDAGEPLKMQIPFRNISNQKFDSLQVQLILTDKSNQANIIYSKKTKPIVSGDTARISVDIDTKKFTGSNLLYLEVNPNNLYPEQTHVNNFFYRNLYVKADVVNPALDVTFDGVRIMNNDIVSSLPKIKIALKDNSKYLLLKDTAAVSVQLRYPNNSIRQFHYTNDTLTFHPATGTDNNAFAEFSPYLKDDGEYQLIVKAKDISGNLSASNDYTVSFSVLNKPMISDMFNYPNPFTTSTAFVFTLTGSEVPQNLKIRIMTITGKIVKEIPKEELGPLHIGKNITEYKWDGKDQFGNELGNGVYLYQIITGANGKGLERYEIKDSRGDVIDTQRFFNKGYGKMYLMR